jgi:hypothetical protein
MEENPIEPNFDKIYQEASNWLRMVNTIIWITATVFVPLSLACFPLAVQKPEYKIVFAVASLILFGIWVYVSMLYIRTGVIAREAIFIIETQWHLDERIAFYSKQGQISSKWYGLRNLQLAISIILVIMWLWLVFG